ncbi:unnamed protein product [Bursaphelenchus okinawaensis]|uniref:Uncharacterized protein n=1 Tax=Bursaphelenchus okinawaensis TaxID=465554 RepID=A0A811L7D0_9BILA|nr:unnamed protein product [Bursaphelenchus okinawaensis]CAG9119683.1 unnamed protein product [Bursaphelenchus okinawaensis]
MLYAIEGEDGRRKRRKEETEPALTKEAVCSSPRSGFGLVLVPKCLFFATIWECGNKHGKRGWKTMMKRTDLLLGHKKRASDTALGIVQLSLPFVFCLEMRVDKARRIIAFWLD